MNIGHYEVIDLIGDGGMGAVYRARDPRFDRLVAIKVLHPQFQRDPGVVERFKSEAVIQAKLNHPHIVTVHDFIADETTLAIVMEHIEGAPLDQIIEKSHGPMAVERVVRIMDRYRENLGVREGAHGDGREDGNSGLHVAGARQEPEARRRAIGHLLLGCCPI
jgi:predicted Ser/Thr protein kinase